MTKNTALTSSSQGRQHIATRSMSSSTMSSVHASLYGLGVNVFHPQNNCCSNVYVDGVFGVIARNDAKGGIPSRPRMPAVLPATPSAPWF